MNFSTLIWCSLPVGLSLVVVGFVILIYIIPQAGKTFRDSESRTEFYSVRAAYWCTIAGLYTLVLFVTSLAIRYAMGSIGGGR